MARLPKLPHHSPQAVAAVFRELTHRIEADPDVMLTDVHGAPQVNRITTDSTDPQ